VIIIIKEVINMMKREDFARVNAITIIMRKLVIIVVVKLLVPVITKMPKVKRELFVAIAMN
jgi:hypothetical protein